MVDHDGALVADLSPTLFETPGLAPGAHDHAPQQTGQNVMVGATIQAISTSAVEGDEVLDTGQKPAVAINDHLGTVADYSVTPALDFFERFHIIPRKLAFGNVLSTTSQTIEVFSAFRKSQETWDTFVNNAGTGVDLLGEPSLATTIQPLLTVPGLSVEVTLGGPPSVNSTLDFGFSTPETIYLPITLERVILWSIPPQLPYGEFLEFYTEIFPHKDASEQRVRLRKNPRQVFQWDFLMEQGPERARLDNLLFGWQQRSFGLPVWHESTYLTIAATAGDTVLTVKSTAYADYRTSGSNLILIFQDQTTFDVQPLDSLTDTTLTLDSPLNNSYAAGIRVMPCRVGVVKRQLRGGRFTVGLAKLRLQARVEDNDISIADTSAFSSYNSKVLLDGFNAMTGKQIKESFRQNTVVIDPKTGLTFQTSSWDKNKHGYTKTFLTNSPQTLWEHRQLIHSLGGKHISWYLPTFAEDLEVSENLASGSPLMAITNVGYNKFVDSAASRAHIRVVFNNGDPPLLREVLSSVEDSTVKETLTLDQNWPSTYLVNEVERVEYVELVRFNTDRIAFRHQKGDTVTKIQGAVVTVQA